MKITSTVTIQAKPSKVFKIFTDLSKTPEYVSGINNLEILEGPSQMALGTKWKETRTVFGKEETETMWVSEFNKNKSYAIDAESHGTKYHTDITFKEVDGATQVAWAFQGSPQTFVAKVMSILAFLFAGSIKKLLDQDLRDLKKACETS